MLPFATPLIVFIRSGFQYLVERLLGLALFLWIAYALGWFHRFVRWIAEREATKLLNGTVVTLGSLQTNLIRGQAWASNVVIHAPHQEAWQWEAPVLARIGKVYVEANVIQCLFFLWFYQQEIPLELYTVHLSDIQVFVERKHNQYNFFLLDPHVISPDLPTSDARQSLEQRSATGIMPLVGQGVPGSDPSVSSNRAIQSSSVKEDVPSTPQHLNPTDNNNNSNDKAQQVVDEMLTAVRRAAQDGDHGAFWTHYRHTLTDQLKQLTQSRKSKSQAMQEGVHLIQQVTGRITKTAASAQQVVKPARRRLPGDERPVFGRVGRVLLQDMHIFLRENNSNSNSSNLTENSNRSFHWNTPIRIQRVVIRASEFCPPLSALDDADGRPALYQPLDECLEVVWKRVLAEMAKSNTGRFFQTAIGEAADVFFTKTWNNTNSSNVAQTTKTIMATTPTRE